jgi:hypothetical protein
VKLLGSDKEAGKFTFRFEQAEREWFRHILELYPVQQTPLRPINDDASANELLHMIMHVCAAWQGTLMAAVDGTDAVEPPQNSFPL